MSWLAHAYWWLTGARDEGGRAYGLWSGFGGSIPDFLILGGALTYYKQHECHNGTCHWPARHTTAQGYRLCKRCVAKPAATLTLHEVHQDHK